jgi:hypothetical protein
MESKNDPIFDEISSFCGHHRVKDLMVFRHDWNREIVAQFYTTVLFGHTDDERAMLWMTNGNKYGIRFSWFLALFNLGQKDKNYLKLHNGGLLEPEALYFMYPSDQRANVGHGKGLYTYYSVLNRLLQASIAPRDGNPSNISRFMKNLMIALRLGHLHLVWGTTFGRRSSTYQRILRRSAAIARTSTYMVERVTKMEFPKDVTHKPL